MSTRQVQSLAAVLVLFAAACGGSDDVDTNIPGATTTTAPTTETTPPLTPSTTTAPPPTTTSPAPGDLPTIVNGDFLVANDDGVFLVDDDFLFQLITGPVERAVDDGAGGVVFQRSSDGYSGPEPDPLATIIHYLPENEFEPRELLVPTGEQFLELRDVHDGTVWYTRREGNNPDTSSETLRTYDLSTRVVDQFAITGGWESGALEVSVGGSNVAAFWSSEAVTGFQFYAESGGMVSFAGNPYGFEQFCGDGELFDAATSELVDGPCYEHAELSDDGRLAYYETGSDGTQVRWALVVVDLESDEELFRLDLNRPDQGWRPVTIDLGDDLAIVNRTETGFWGAPMTTALVVDLNSGAVTELGISGEARFLTGPMGIS